MIYRKSKRAKHKQTWARKVRERKKEKVINRKKERNTIQKKKERKKRRN